MKASSEQQKSLLARILTFGNFEKSGFPCIFDTGKEILNLFPQIRKYGVYHMQEDLLMIASKKLW